MEALSPYHDCDELWDRPGGLNLPHVPTANAAVFDGVLDGVFDGEFDCEADGVLNGATRQGENLQLGPH